jgi:Predicted membrane protein (DUF2207)
MDFQQIMRKGKGIVHTCLLAVILLLSNYESVGQSFMVSETSAGFVADRDYDSLIAEQFLPYAVSKNISESDFKARYAEYKPRFIELLQAILQNPITALDKKFVSVEPGTPAYGKARMAYLGEIRRAVEMALNNPSAFYPMFEPDLSDRILRFHADIKVEKNGEVNVTEYITIYNGNGQGNSANNDIQRGIVRDFPTVYTDKKGYKVKTGFSLKRVEKNGLPEPYQTQLLMNGERIMVGKSDIFIADGVYTYKLEYTTKNQVRFDSTKDELYWNVNGTGWVFTADSISCSISFPEGAKIFEFDCYTGVQGSTDKDCLGTKVSGNEIFFSATRRMNAYEGLTVAAAIEKGVLTAPGNGVGIQLFKSKLYTAVSVIFIALSFCILFSGLAEKRP